MSTPIPAIGSRWKLTDHQEFIGKVYVVIEQLDCNGWPYFRMRIDGTEDTFVVELPWFERRASKADVRRITPEQETMINTLVFGVYGRAAQLTPAEVATWARGEALPQPKAQHAKRACEALGIEAVWL